MGNIHSKIFVTWSKIQLQLQRKKAMNNGPFSLPVEEVFPDAVTLAPPSSCRIRASTFILFSIAIVGPRRMKVRDGGERMG